MTPTTIMLTAAGFLAVTTLLKLMDRRRMQLTEILREYASVRMEWSRKRARAAKMARQVAKQNTIGEDDEPEGLPERSQKPMKSSASLDGSTIHG